MGKELLALSFFKDKNIGYYFNIKRDVIMFPCVHCGKEAAMDSKTTNWKCPFCDQKGNLVNLASYMTKEPPLPSTKIYNPKTEWNLIKNRFHKLIERHGGEVESLFKKTDDLISYYKSVK